MTTGTVTGTAAPTIQISTETYQFLRQWIHRESGILLEENKEYLLQSRLSPVLQLRKLVSLDALCSELRSGTPELSRQVVEAMTTHETLFFRDRAPFDALRDTIVPELLKNRPRGHKLQLWSAAASSGQEAYSLAILLLEMGLTQHEFSIVGTDLSARVLQRAREGLYGGFEVKRGLSQELLQRYFEPQGTVWRVKEQVKATVRFEQMDLRALPVQHGPFDVVLCRNVLIYFDGATKTRVQRALARSMARGGYLFLGAAESLDPQSQLERVKFADAVAYRAD